MFKTQAVLLQSLKVPWQTEFFTCKMVVSSFSLRITSVSLLVHQPSFALRYDYAKITEQRSEMP